MNVLFPYTCELRELDPADITVKPCLLSDMKQLQPMCSRAIWRPHPAYYIARLVIHKNEIIGLIYLGMPVYSMAARDRFLKLPVDPKKKGLALLSYPDLAVCVGVQPLAWHWNLGKLCALVAAGLGPDWKSSSKTEMKGVITTSYYGRSSQYNQIYTYVGKTAGFGDLHVTDEKIRQMQAFLRARGVVVKEQGKITTSYRMKAIQEYVKRQQSWYPGVARRAVYHGQIRYIYYHEADNRPLSEIITAWYERWGLPRYKRTKHESPPYRSGLEEKNT